jgi:pyridoxal phosphate enzyme (YggS family)
MIAKALSDLLSEIPPGITLVAVSKTKPVEQIMECYNAGHRDFGENYVQELVSKQAELPKDIRWHFIGHLQSNKVKMITPFVHLVHGVDSLKLLNEIDKQSAKTNRVVNCLLQLYIAQEETKFGLSFDECSEILNGNELNTLKNVNVCGFMAMASNTTDEKKIREEFRSLVKYQQSVLSARPALKILSFGMSSDFRIAIEEGSTMLRVGSLIFGERSYPPQ